jgi:predicted glycosyltransferase
MPVAADIQDKNRRLTKGTIVQKQARVKSTQPGIGHRPTTKKIWIDLDNSPHVPLFVPIVQELERKGYSVFLTARECFQVCGLADKFDLNYTRVGKHYGANKLMKIIGTLWRSLQLLPIVLRERPDSSMSHGSRPLVLLSALLGIPTALLFDYEYAKTLPFVKPTLGVAPEVIDNSGLAKRFKRGLRSYQGLKEDVYVSSFKPDPSILREFDLTDRDIVVTIRPPASEAHYHNPDADRLFLEVVEFLGSTQDVRMIILPRNEKTQRELVYQTWPKWCAERRIIIPDRVVDGLNLVWHSDFVISGGGTMNREAAALGVPVYSIFRGKLGAVDRYLAQHHRLILIESVEDVRAKIRPVRRPKKGLLVEDRLALKQILAVADELIVTEPVTV